MSVHISCAGKVTAEWGGVSVRDLGSGWGEDGGPGF